MKRTTYLIVFLFAVALVSCKNENKEKTTEEEVEVEKEVVEEVEVKEIKFSLESKSDSEATGTVTFTEEGGLVSMTAEISGLSEGVHAIHIHEKADCSSADGKSSGGHWNPTFQPHGKWDAPDGYHLGDIGNFLAKADGTATVTFETDKWCIGCGDDKKDIMGKAIIVHQGSDDFTSQPSGAAGARISCGGIIE